MLPSEYHDYADVFLKTASDELPLHCMNSDHHIELNEGMGTQDAVGYHPLYKMSQEELEAAHAYILDNLNKGFIVPSVLLRRLIFTD